MAKRAMVKMAALAIGAASLAGVMPASASASPQSVQLCQDSGAALKYKYYTSSGTIATWSKTCSGSYSLNSGGYSIYAGGWSGYVYFSDGTSSDFCDGETRYLGGRRVVKIYMAAAKIEECV
ncbi:hypothetical protein [Streptomyces fragilis]|uniref:Secreted protein n=1 Tax=Streptomyces fragilis TaxID=67301 RepID=A0ABV2YE04_9ACTN|nr:hypothetical protein [Streptomyces fragilis]